ncbi:Vacuolar protein sorting-associated protein 27 [Frankliniella fusca]|uniref:Vacuolar protein sorting-associated protein 27 n=1 Tax=Frankliniella fusca TaxID=407009 RepID=A0AAE1GZZ3_9NEOP|nr:Vacuolar protein sorting-associated protein 27 [Frankliniella fusca]
MFWQKVDISQANFCHICPPPTWFIQISPDRNPNKALGGHHDDHDPDLWSRLVLRRWTARRGGAPFGDSNTVSSSPSRGTAGTAKRSE